MKNNKDKKNKSYLLQSSGPRPDVSANKKYPTKTTKVIRRTYGSK